MKGILLAGGSGSRLRPFTHYTSKQLLPVYNKPMIYYPLSTLMMAGIKDVIIISSSQDVENYKTIINAKSLGMNIEYAVQDTPNGIAEALILAENFVNSDDVCLILGDNMFYGSGFRAILKTAKEEVQNTNNGVILGYSVKDPERFGVIEHDDEMKILSIEEKPQIPKSDVASAGIYFLPNDSINKAKTLTPSLRGELEITDVLNKFLNENRLLVKTLHRGFTWFDMGTIKSLSECSLFIKQIEENTHHKISLIEEIAYIEGFIDKSALIKSAEKYKNTEIYDYIMNIK